MSIEVLSPLNHRCTACGGSCQGSFAFLSEEEQIKVTAQASVLGVERPVEDGHLRQHLGSCVFLEKSGLCRIHKKWGFDAKPAVCKQYPLVAVRTETGVRVGIDPGCYTHIQSAADPEAEVEASKLFANQSELPPGMLPFEQAFLDRSEGISIAGALSMLTAEKTIDGGLPSGWASRWVEFLKGSELGLLMALQDTPLEMRRALEPMVEAIETWDPKNPPRWTALHPRLDAWGVDVTRRMLHLRLATDTLPVVPAVALLTLGGVVAAAWTNPEEEPFTRAVAAWCRGVRIETFWRGIVAEPADFQRLATGG